jgi:steroid delta-isomerase-like uncharacterized protein
MQTILHEWFEEVWNRGNTDAVERLLASDAVIHNLDEQGRDSRGPEEFLAFWTRYRSAFPDTRITVHDSVEAGGVVAARWTVAGTHAGDQLGFAPTNRRIEIPGMSMAIVREGKVVEAWNIYDVMGMMRQLGFQLAQAHSA